MKHLEEYIDNQSNPYSLTTEQLQSRSEELQAMADYLKRISVSWTTSRPEKNTSLTYDIATEIEDDFYTIRMNIAEQAEDSAIEDRLIEKHNQSLRGAQ